MPASPGIRASSTGRARAACGRAAPRRIASGLRDRHEQVAELQSGKGHRDENFPVASFLIAPKHRAPVLAFYSFVRFADDIADHASAPRRTKSSRLLEEMRAEPGRAKAMPSPEGVALRDHSGGARPFRSRMRSICWRPFAATVTKLRYRDWDDLMDYCRYSRHAGGPLRAGRAWRRAGALWPANDALCAALQVINHLQDCAKDYRELNRVYIPEAAAGRSRASASRPWAKPTASPALQSVIAGLARKNAELLAHSRAFAGADPGRKACLEVDLIQTLAEDLNTMLIAPRSAVAKACIIPRWTWRPCSSKRLPAFALLRLRRQRQR